MEVRGGAWIIQPSRLSEIVGEAGGFYSYRVIAGESACNSGRINKRFLSYYIELGWAKIISNPLEAYAWEVLLKNDQKA